MRQRGHDLGLVLEAGECLHVAGERVGKDLDGHVAVERRVPGAPDLAHPARAEGRDDLVRAEPGSRGEAHGGCTKAALTGAGIPESAPLTLFQIASLSGTSGAASSLEKSHVSASACIGAPRGFIS